MFTCDFEIALWKSLLRRVEKEDIHGCFFHLTNVSMCICAPRIYGLHLNYYESDFDQTQWKCLNLIVLSRILQAISREYVLCAF